MSKIMGAAWDFDDENFGPLLPYVMMIRLQILTIMGQMSG